MRIILEKVRFMPKGIMPGVLYVSEEFGTAAHLCACGCGSKIRTPLGPTEWAFQESEKGPSIFPSIGNWQLACKSHYWIHEGEIKWAESWTPEQIFNGRFHEDERRKAYFNSRHPQKMGVFHKIWSKIKEIF